MKRWSASSRSGAEVKRFKLGERYLVQTDYRWLPTANSNSAFGYNFEGALQEYVLLDERVITAPDGESMLIPVPEDLSASAIALCEPWACVEDAYVEKQRQTLQDATAKLLVVGDTRWTRAALWSLPGKPKPLTVTTVGQAGRTGQRGLRRRDLFRHRRRRRWKNSFAKVGAGGLFNIVPGGRQIWPRRSCRRWAAFITAASGIIGTTGRNAADALAAIPATAEIRAERQDQHHRRRRADGHDARHPRLCQGVPDVTVFAGDLSDERLAMLHKLAEPLAAKEPAHAARLQSVQGEARRRNSITSSSWRRCRRWSRRPSRTPRRAAIINIFAGIPADKTGEIDLDAYIEKQLLFHRHQRLDARRHESRSWKKLRRASSTPICPSPPIAGLDGAIDGIRAVEKNLMPGKIIVYPSCRGLKLTPLTELGGIGCPLSRRPLEQTGRRSTVKQIPRNMNAALAEQDRPSSPAARRVWARPSRSASPAKAARSLIADMNEKRRRPKPPRPSPPKRPLPSRAEGGCDAGGRRENAL